jgi:predicted MFS family arabinose efflux permease
MVRGVRRGALARGEFRLLFAGTTVSSFGDRLVPVALAFAVLDLTGSVADLGFVLAAQTVPLAVFVLLGGVWADRLPRQLVMLASDLVRALTQGTTAVLLLTGQAHIWELAVLQAAYGIAEAFFGPASTALVPQTVAESDLQQANALLGLSGNVAAVLGPAVAGVIVATTRPGWGLAADGVTFLVSALFLSRLRIAAHVPRTRTSTLQELRAGWRTFRSHNWLWITVLYFTLFLAAVFGPLQVLGPQVARQALGGAGAWAAISTALGVGALIGGTVGLRWRPRYPLRAAFVGFLIGTPALVALVAAHAPLPAIITLGVIDGATGTFFNIMWFTALQRAIPPAELSRVSSWDYLGSLVLLPVGQAASGPLAAAIGLSTSLYAASIVAAVMLLGVLAVPEVRNFSLPAATVSEPRRSGGSTGETRRD